MKEPLRTAKPMVIFLSFFCIYVVLNIYLASKFHIKVYFFAFIAFALLFLPLIVFDGFAGYSLGGMAENREYTTLFFRAMLEEVFKLVGVLFICKISEAGKRISIKVCVCVAIYISLYENYITLSSIYNSLYYAIFEFDTEHYNALLNFFESISLIEHLNIASFQPIRLIFHCVTLLLDFNFYRQRKYHYIIMIAVLHGIFNSSALLLKETTNNNGAEAFILSIIMISTLLFVIGERHRQLLKKQLFH